jgi:hypothetical protein
MKGPFIHVDLVARPLGIAGQRIRVPAGAGPRGFHLAVPFLAKRKGGGRAVVGQAAVGLADDAVNVMLSGDGVVQACC